MRPFGDASVRGLALHARLAARGARCGAVVRRCGTLCAQYALGGTSQPCDALRTTAFVVPLALVCLPELR